MLQQQEHPSQVPVQQIGASPMIQVDFTPLQRVQPNLIEEEDKPTTLSPSDELLRWHYKLGPLPFKTLQQMSTRGELPCKLATVIPPFCAACKYGKQT